MPGASALGVRGTARPAEYTVKVKPEGASFHVFVFPAVALLCFLPQRTSALPTMVRLGYPNCARLPHLSAGRRPAESLRKEHRPGAEPDGRRISTVSSALESWVNWNDRITQDLRTIIQQQDVSTDGKPGTQLFRTRFLWISRMPLW